MSIGPLIGGAVATLVGFFFGLVVATVIMKKKIQAVLENTASPDNPIRKGIQAHLVGVFLPMMKSVGDVAESHDQQSGCPRKCGASIANLIRSAALTGFSGSLKKDVENGS